MRNSRWYLPLLSLASAALISLSWYEPFTLLAFVAFVPLLLLADEMNLRAPKRPYWQFFGYAYLAMLGWNVGVIWWLWNASGWVTLAAWGLNALFQSWPLLAYFFVLRRAKRWALVSFVAYYMAFEYLHLNWDLSWVWLNLGNVFANTPSWVQWFEFTGSFGGSLWVLLANALFYLYAKNRNNKQLAIAATSVAFPLALSLAMYYTYQEKGKPVEVVVVQPNLDCYTEKFTYNAKTGEREQATYVPYEQQVQRHIDLAQKAITPNTALVAFPETSLHDTKTVDFVGNAPDIVTLKNWLRQHPKLSLIAGADLLKQYGEKNENLPLTARYADGFGYYDVFNSAIYLNSDASLQPEIYHKSKLVIGAETTPFIKILRPLMLNFGGVSGALGSQPERSIFAHNDRLAAGPVICYESVYGEFVTEYVQKGATFLCIITNDGWWGNTSGHKQHLAYASLRAIETRKAIARAANTGISGFINARGDLVSATLYDEPTALRGTVLTNTEVTWYVRWGDYLGRFAAFLVPFLFSVALFAKRKQ